MEKNQGNKIRDEKGNVVTDTQKWSNLPKLSYKERHRKPK